MIYYPPRSPQAEGYIDHIISTIDALLLKYPEAGFMIMGDFNDLDIAPILCNERFTQIVKEPTRGDNVLDKIITNHANLFHPVSIISPIASSDHNSVLWTPKIQDKVRNSTKTRVVRPFKDSGIRSFGEWITNHSWEDIEHLRDPSEKCDMLIETVRSQLDTHLPTKRIRLHENDRPWVTAEVKTLIRRRQVAFAQKHLVLWRHLRNKTSRAIASAKHYYYNTRVRNLKAKDPASWYRKIKLITHGPHDQLDIDIPHLSSSKGNSASEIANCINDHFCAIAADLPSLDRTRLPAFLPSQDQCPIVHPREVYSMLSNLSLCKATTSKDLPARILKEFACELACPLADILNTSFQQSIVPHQWKLAEVVPIPKCQPSTLQNLRPIALTCYFAKIAESFIAKWLVEDISAHIDANQYGNRKGLSTNHYLIELLHQILHNAENQKSMSTIVLTDFSKAFDRIDHNVLIRKLINLGVRPCLISWIISFLERRVQCVKYHGKTSDWNNVNAGVPQGTKLGPILFLIMINDACEDSAIQHLKYVDDLTLIESKKVNDQSNMQKTLDELCSWTEKNNMKLNPSKCLTMSITFSRLPHTHDALLIGNVELCNVKEAKILGVLVQSNLKWDSHVAQVIKKCNRKLYMLRSLKRFNMPPPDLVTVYTGYIRPVLEYACPVFNSSLTKKQESQLESIQKRACKIILGKDYTTYETALCTCKLLALSERREQLCLAFAKSIEKNPNVSHWLQIKESNHEYSLRSNPKYQQYRCKTKRFQTSPIPYFIKLLNNESSTT